MRAKLRLPLVVILALGGIAGVGNCRQAVRLAAEDAGGPSVPLAVLRVVAFFGAAAAAWRFLGPRSGEPAPTLAEEARARVADGVRAHPAVALATASGAQALFLAWGLFLVINVGLVAAAVAERSRVTSIVSEPRASEIATVYVVAHALPLLLVWKGSFGLSRAQGGRRAIAKSLVLAIVQTAAIAAIVVPCSLVILILASGHGVSD